MGRKEKDSFVACKLPSYYLTDLLIPNIYSPNMLFIMLVGIFYLIIIYLVLSLFSYQLDFDFFISSLRFLYTIF